MLRASKHMPVFPVTDVTQSYLVKSQNSPLMTLRQPYCAILYLLSSNIIPFNFFSSSGTLATFNFFSSSGTLATFDALVTLNLPP